ncbi:MAG: hypothetical protein A2081_01345 [Elusimicrobia bacterium GWC2_61_19]|nr:MAG: hypothetical protein A2081_01345 [Elusimicrobia bacterium GWC2_61_19]
MKTLLIFPPQQGMIKTSVPNFINQKLGHYPPLGLLYIASYMEKHSSHEVTVLDTQVEEMGYPEIKAAVERIKPDLVGIYTLTFALMDALKVAAVVKSADERILVCSGGPHPTIYPRETVAQKNVDFAVSGEGEAAFLKLADTLAAGGDLRQVPGLTFKEAGAAVTNPKADPIENLDELPFPSRRSLPYGKYTSIIAKTAPVTTFISSRGCPFNCSFCATSRQRWRPRSVENIIAELEECVALGIREFFFFDDTFAISKERVLKLCAAIEARGLKILFDIRTRVDTVDAEMLAALKKAGCERVQYGVEAGTPEILATLKKGIDLDRVRAIFKTTRDLGITTFADFMIGSPGETREHIKKTVDFALELKPDFVQFSITTPFPATELYDESLRLGVFSEDYWQKYAQNPDENFTPSLWNEHLTREELENLTKQAYKRFYLRPSYVLKKAAGIRSFGELARHVVAGLHLLKVR